MADKATQGGIQMLLKAEKVATEKVGEARKRKYARLKQAKDEAMEEMDTYREEREQHYRAIEKNIVGTEGSEESQVSLDTDLQLQELEKIALKNKEKAMERLLALIVDVQVEMHKNLKLQQG